MNMSNGYVRIVEQPAEKSFRFRYESEGRLNGSIVGAKSTNSKVTYPKIEICNYTGEAVILISCIARNSKKQHPHKLSSKHSVGAGGIYSIKVYVEHSKIIEFKDLGIISIKRNNISASLKERQKKRIDPFNEGFGHMEKPQFIDVHAVRLCFQVIVEENKKFNAQLPPVVSNVIFDKSSNGFLKIVEMSSASSPATGGDRMIMLCDKVKREDIAVVFYEEDDKGSVVWRKELTEKALKVHHQYAISFQIPPYKDCSILEPKRVFVQLHRPSNQDTGDALPFDFLPTEQSIQLRRKRQKTIHDAVKPSLTNFIDNLKKQQPADEFPLLPNLESLNTIAGTEKQPLKYMNTPAKQEFNIVNHTEASNMQIDHQLGTAPAQNRANGCNNCQYAPPQMENYQQIFYPSHPSHPNNYYPSTPAFYNPRPYYTQSNVYHPQYYPNDVPMDAVSNSCFTSQNAGMAAPPVSYSPQANFDHRKPTKDDLQPFTDPNSHDIMNELIAELVPKTTSEVDNLLQNMTSSFEKFYRDL